MYELGLIKLENSNMKVYPFMTFVHCHINQVTGPIEFYNCSGNESILQRYCSIIYHVDETCLGVVDSVMSEKYEKLDRTFVKLDLNSEGTEIYLVL